MSEAVYLWLEDAVSGPHELHDLAEMVRSGGVSLSDLWSADGANDWRPLSEIVTVTEPEPAAAIKTKLCDDCEGVVSLRAADCPHCGAPLRKKTKAEVPIAQESIGVTRRKRKVETFGAGCAVQLLGLGLMFVFWPIGLMVMLGGHFLAYKWICGNCGNKVEKTAAMCPACRFQIQ
jgi:RNA polymerase subunit RPABC4/transcription elongation factor Spt4